MRVRVRMRVNTETGAVEVFQVDDIGAELPQIDHDEHHDQIAAELGRLVERRPQVTEVEPIAHVGLPPLAGPGEREPGGEAEPARAEREREAR
jgi:hypothetical protein